LNLGGKRRETSRAQDGVVKKRVHLRKKQEREDAFTTNDMGGWMPPCPNKDRGRGRIREKEDITTKSF